MCARARRRARDGSRVIWKGELRENEGASDGVESSRETSGHHLPRSSLSLFLPISFSHSAHSPRLPPFKALSRAPAYLSSSLALSYPPSRDPFVFLSLLLFRSPFLSSGEYTDSIVLDHRRRCNCIISDSDVGACVCAIAFSEWIFEIRRW